LLATSAPDGVTERHVVVRERALGRRDEGTCSPGPVVTSEAGAWYSPRMRREPHALAQQPGLYGRATGAGSLSTGSGHRLQSLARFTDVPLGARRDGTGAFV